jgi:hypothetical protein
MQVPVFLTRQVFVKLVPAGTISLSAMVTSATKAALLVQSGELVGMGVSGVAVALACADGVSVAVVMTVGASVAIAARVSVTVGTAVSAGDRAPQAEVINTTKRQTTNNFFLIKTSIQFETAEEDNFIIYKKYEKNIIQKTGKGIWIAG